MDEKIREIPGFPDYSISKDGKVFRTYFRNKQTSHPMKPKEIRQFNDTAGYKMVDLSKNNIATMQLVHRLVLLTFIGDCPNGCEAAHLNGIKTDNRMENLVWVTRKENLSHRVLHGTSPVGSKNPKAKLTEKDVVAIKMQLGTSLKQRNIAKSYGVSEQLISDIKHRRRWCHV